MKISILQENLNSGLSTVSRFVSGKTQLPILNNILWQTDNNQLCLSATNLELGINLWLGAKVEKEGKITLPAKEITEFVSYLSPGRIEIEAKDETKIEIQANSGKAVFVGAPSDDFPAIPHLDEKSFLTVSLESLTKAVSQVGFAASVDETRPALSGIFWQFTDMGYQMVATDGYRLSLKTISEKVPVGDKASFLIPARSLMEAVRLAKEDKIKVSFSKNGNQIVFGLSDCEISSRLLDEKEFPDYQKILPQEHKTRMVVDKEEFLQAIKAASVFARESANVIRFLLEKDKLVISANASSVGENTNMINAKIEGEANEIAFNYRFLIDFLNAASGEEVSFEMNESLSPGVFRVDADDSWLHLIMPVRLQE